MNITVEEKLANIKTKFLTCIEYLGNTKSEDYEGIRRLLTYTYHYCRLLKLYPDELKLSYEEKEKFCRNFPGAARIAIQNIFKVYDMIEPDQINVLKEIRSGVRFFKCDVFKIYKDFENNNVPPDLKVSMHNFGFVDETIEAILNNWESPTFGDAVDRDSDVPNLIGVPKLHNWWKEKHRNLWKNKDAFQDDYGFAFFKLYFIKNL